MMDLLRGASRALAIFAVTAGTVSAVTASGTAAAPAASASRCDTGYLQAGLHLAGVTVDAASLNATGSFTATGQPPLTGLPAFCDVTLTQADGSGNALHIEAWLPEPWNGRFQGVGGAVYECGPLYNEMAAAVQGGYASAATDCGVPPADALTGSWALKNGQLDWPLINDFASVGIHDMSVAGKAVTQLYYPSPLRFSYFNGCSTGGREGLMEAQRYPADYNGISSGAPAINWTKFIPAEIWPELVMNASGDFLPACKENAFTESAVQACATTDGVITNPDACDWNPDKLVGLVTPCGVITHQDAAVMTKIWQGPESADGKPLWYGLERGASLAGLAATTTSNGVTTGTAFPVAVSWLGTWLRKNPSWDWHTLTYGQFDGLFSQSVSEFSDAIATDNPDLSAFKKDGGKILIWHGLADQLIFPQGTINYYQRVQRAMGGPAATGSFARLFLASGAQHCASAAGPAPAQPLDAVVAWVERGVAPASIPGTTTDPATGVVTDSRPVCEYPLFARYTGHGSTTQANSFICAAPG
ncbi:MAG: tannase/feruloyl esterase family alpha/beta hydrolase [Streptosporangiaceae bacterium]|nr:tannase/feruloyl esterase family alpha/beta hydrolase [Streptosporangiaceae bacterium]